MTIQKILSCLAALVLSLSVQGQNIYRVFRVTGNVTRSDISKSDWRSVHKRDTLKSSELIRIPAGGEIRIVASENGVIYVCSQPGTYSLKDVITKGKEAQQGLLAAVTSELANESRSKAGGSVKLSAHGATVRTGLDDGMAELELAQSIRQGEKGLALRLVRKGSFYRFRIKNTGEACAVCVACLKPGDASLCLPGRGVIVSKGITTLKEPMIEPCSDGKYVAFRVPDELYDESLLMLILSK